MAKRVFSDKIDQFFIAKGAEIIEDFQTFTVSESSSDYEWEVHGRASISHTETKYWNAFSLGHGAVKIRANGKGQALLYTATEQISLSIVELKEEFDEYLLLFEEEIKAAEEEARQLELKRQQQEAAARLEKTKKETWEKEVPGLYEALKGKEVHYDYKGHDYKIIVTQTQRRSFGRYEKVPVLRIEGGTYVSPQTWEFLFELPENPLTTGGIMKYAFEEAPEGITTYGELYEFIKTH